MKQASLSGLFSVLVASFSFRSLQGQHSATAPTLAARRVGMLSPLRLRVRVTENVEPTPFGLLKQFRIEQVLDLLSAFLEKGLRTLIQAAGDDERGLFPEESHRQGD